MTSFAIISVILGTFFSIIGSARSIQPEPILLNVEELKGIAGFRSVQLSWKYIAIVPPKFTVKYCEVVAWGKDKCVMQPVNDSDSTQANDVINGVDHLQSKRYETEIHGLHLATNYTFEVQPTLEDGKILTPIARARSLQHNEVTILTKGFSANPKLCLSDRSEVDVETGPLFGGHISVEGAVDKRCTWIGDPRESSTVHTFVINHEICGGIKKDNRIETIIIVSESRSIITHTARRFMVVCNLLPETFTIKASIQIPGEYDRPEETNEYSLNNEVPVNNVRKLANEERNKEESFWLGKQRSNNRRIASQQSAELQEVAHQYESNRTETTTAHLVLMVLLTVAAAVGILTTVWWFVVGFSKQRQFDLTTYEEQSPTYEIDYGLTKSGHISYDANNYCVTTVCLASSMSDAFNSNNDSNC